MAADTTAMRALQTALSQETLEDGPSMRATASPSPSSKPSSPGSVRYEAGGWRRSVFEEEDANSDGEEAPNAAELYKRMKMRIAESKLSDSERNSNLHTEQQDATVPSRQPSPHDHDTGIGSHASGLEPAKSIGRPTLTLDDSNATDSDLDVPVASNKRRRRALIFQTSDSEEMSNHTSGSEDDLPDAEQQNDRLKQLIVRRREERMQKEAEEDAKKQARQTQHEMDVSLAEDNLTDVDEDEDGPATDRAIEDKFTQEARPARKASKKALEEMHKETQRMSRNMQLTHQAKVKKKYTMADFTTRFKSKSVPPQEASMPACSSSPVPVFSDHEDRGRSDTPPSSPPSEGEAPLFGKSILQPSLQATEQAAVLPETSKDGRSDIVEQPIRSTSKGKATKVVPAAASTRSPARRYRIIHLDPKHDAEQADSDDDLEIVKPRFAVFDTVKPRKANASKADHNLRVLAGLHAQESNGRTKSTKKQPSMTSAQLDLQLRRRAAVQAKQERDEKIAALRARGIVVQTQEEREHDQMEIEDLLEKARLEAQDLRKKEKEAAKAEGREMDIEVSDDESEDEEWREENGQDGDDEAENAEEDEEEVNIALSGSEDEDLEDEEEDDNIESGGMFDDAAEEADSEREAEEDESTEATMDPELRRTQDLPQSLQPWQRTRRKKRVIEDDEDEADEEVVVKSQHLPSTEMEATQPTQVEDLAAAFGFAAAPHALMSPSQMFAGTMGASQSQLDKDSYESVPTQEQDSMDLFNQMIPSAEARGPSPLHRESSQASLADGVPQQDMVTTETPRVDLAFSRTMMESPALSRFSQLSALPSPSQDAGYRVDQSPLVRAGSLGQSTIDTIVLAVPESPLPQRKSRLQQRRHVVDDDSEDEQMVASSAIQQETSAFEVMRKARARTATEADFDKKKSEAKQMVEEQAEESEDEYAGLGGVSGDESGGEEEEADKQMIDEGDVKVDERKLAAFYAENSRVENEAQTSKLYKDLMSGALRRQRGDAFDLDSDEDEQIAERRRRKQREEARKRRLLLGDEKLGKFEGNDKKEAFLRAIEDRDEEDDVDMLDGKDRDAEESVPDSQTESASQQVSQEGENIPLQPVSGNALKRKASDTIDGTSKRQAVLNTSASSLRRTVNAAFTKPTSLAEVRASLSFLVEEPHNEPLVEVQLSDSEGEEEGEQEERSNETGAEGDVPAERAPYSARRTPARTATSTTTTTSDVIDRLVLLRQTSSSLSASNGTGSGSGLAFLSRSASATTTLFKTPASLLRRATTSSATAKPGSMGPPPPPRRDSTSSSGSGSGSSIGGGEVRRASGKRSGIHFAAREAERLAAVEKVERRRREDVRRVAVLHRGGSVGSVAGRGFAGGFE